MLANTMLKPYQHDFIQFAIDKQVLKFGEFELKSGRISPYFFNAGLFNDGDSLAQLGNFYAQTLIDSKAQFDMLFGPAYKGIPLASSAAIQLAQAHNQNYPFAFNRKEAKDHGEGGNIVGAPLQGNIMIIDDVITAGTAIREVISIIQAHAAKPAGVLVALDRQEKGKNERSAIQEIEAEYAMPVLSIVNLSQVLQFISGSPALSQYSERISAYRDRYGVIAS